MRHFAKHDLIPLLSILSVAFYPCLFLYARNCDEVPASSMIPFLLVFTLTGLLIFGFVSIFLRNAARSALFTDLALLVVINFSLLSDAVVRLIPFFHPRYQLVLLFLLLAALLLLLIKKKPALHTLCLLVLIAFGSMSVVNLAMAIPTLISGGRVSEAPVQEAQEPMLSFGENRPNVYFFLFDEYGGYENLLYYYDYDNSAFLTEMEARGFNVSRESRNSEAVETVTIVPNLLNLNYHVNRWSPYPEKLRLLDNTYMTQLFQSNGYQVQLVNHVDFFGKTGIHVLTKNQTRRTISEILMRNSLFFKFDTCRKLLDDFFTIDYGANYRQSLDNAMEMGLRSWETAQSAPTLTLGYLQFPHSPTMVGPNGEALPYEEGWNWRKHSLYLGQVEYANKYILELSDTLLQKDPDALIILMSDHGNRYAIHMVQLEEWSDYDPTVHNPCMQNILNCVYYQGKSFPIEGETGINTLRMMFREVLDADLPPVEPIEDFTKNYRDEADLNQPPPPEPSHGHAPPPKEPDSEKDPPPSHAHDKGPP